jgi:hypothetical protein
MESAAGIWLSMVARNAQQLPALKQVVASVRGDLELLLARIKLSQLALMRKILSDYANRWQHQCEYTSKPAL